MAVLTSINRSRGGIPKHPIEVVDIDASGIVLDGHDHEKHRVTEQAVSLLDVELLRSIEADFGHVLAPGSLGENLTVEGLGVQRLGAGDRIHIGTDDAVVLEITRVRPPCYVLDAIDPVFKRVLWNRIGMYASVIAGGTVRRGDSIGIELSTGARRPLVRTPKSGCEDGSGTAIRILESCPIVPLALESST